MHPNPNPSTPDPTPPTIHIGLNPTPLSPHCYNTRILSYAPSCHLIINHGQQLSVYNTSPGERRISYKVEKFGHACGYRLAACSGRWKCVFLIDAWENVTVYSYASTTPTHTDNLHLLASSLTLPSLRHCIDFLYLDEYNAFLVLDPHCLKLVFVQIVSNHLRSLFSNAYRFRIEQVAVKVMSNDYFLEFAEKLERVGEYFVLSNSESVKIIWHAVDRNFKEKESQVDIQTTHIAQQILNLVSGRANTGNTPIRKNIIHLTNICQSPEQITQVLYHPQTNMLACGTNQGQLKVYKINFRNIIATNLSTNTTSFNFSPRSPRSPRPSKQIPIPSQTHQSFTLQLHNSKPIRCLQLYSPRILLTIGLDEYLEVVSFDQMSSIERYRCDSNLSSVRFVERDVFVGVRSVDYEQWLVEYEVALNSELVIKHNSEIVQAGFVGGACVLVLTDNSINVLEISQKHKNLNTINQQKQKSKLSIQKSARKPKIQAPTSPPKIKHHTEQPMIPKQSFIPPRCKSILALQIYPYTQKPKNPKNPTPQTSQFWILTDQSQIYCYSYTHNTPTPSLSPPNPSLTPPSTPSSFKITQIHELSSFTDQYKHQTKQKVITMKFVNVVPVHFDSDIKEKNYYVNQGKVAEVRPIAFGCETGELMVCSSLRPREVVARVRYFGEGVRMIAECDVDGGRDRDREEMDSSSGGIDAVRKMFFVASYHQIVAFVLSNYHIPVTVYKLILPQSTFHLKNLNPHMISILTDNTPKLLFPTPQPQPPPIPQSPYSPSQPLPVSEPPTAPTLSLYTPSVTLHSAPLTCLEYCGYLRVLTADCVGKMVLWTIDRQEVLLVVRITEAVRIQLCYWWDQGIVFGREGKVFEIAGGVVEGKGYKWDGDIQAESQQYIINKFLSNKQWIQQNTTQLSIQHPSPTKTSKSPSTIISQYFKFPKYPSTSHPESLPTQMYNTPLKSLKSQSHQLSSSHHKSKSLGRGLDRKEEELNSYMSDMRKSLLKLVNQTQGHVSSPNKSSEKRVFNRFNMGKNRNKSKSHNKVPSFYNNLQTPDIPQPLTHKKSQSTHKNNFLPSNQKSFNITVQPLQLSSGLLPATHRTQVSQLSIATARNKLTRAKSILNRFKQAQEREENEDVIGMYGQRNGEEMGMGMGMEGFSGQLGLLPQISKQTFGDSNSAAKKVGAEDGALYGSKKKKNRNKKFQYLFHFPNVGLYSQLISKNMIQ